jgi:hypothetical protein
MPKGHVANFVPNSAISRQNSWNKKSKFDIKSIYSVYFVPILSLIN